MAFLKNRTKRGKVKRVVKVALSYLRAYMFYHGWSSYVWKNGEIPVKVGKMRFCADPFLFHWHGTNWLFYESLDKKGKGYIGCYKEENGKWVQQGKVLEETWHLSYPQVFEEDGKVYMIPESCDFGKGDVSLYEAVDFPKKWEKVAKLIDRPFADSTILKYEGHWYMACYTIPPKETAELWHAPSLLGTWERHPMWNKINQSNRLRRCGGFFINRDEGLCRVAQDCNGVYGKRLWSVAIDEITPVSYSEGEARVLVSKDAEPFGFKHTYNEITVDGHRISVVDVHRDFWQWPHVVVVNAIKAMMSKLKG